MGGGTIKENGKIKKRKERIRVEEVGTRNWSERNDGKSGGGKKGRRNTGEEREREKRGFESIRIGNVLTFPARRLRKQATNKIERMPPFM